MDFICARCETEPPAGVRPVVLGRSGPFKWIKVLRFALKAAKARREGGYDLSIGLGKSYGHDLLRVGGGPQRNFWKLSSRAWPAGFPRIMKRVRRELSPANHIVQWLERKRLRNGPTIVCVSDLVRGWVCEAHPEVDPASVHVIYNKPDFDRFHPVDQKLREDLRHEAGIAPDDVVITTAGTNFALKGVSTLIKALPHLPGNWRLRVAGGRNPSKYRRLAGSLGVGKRVKFLGKVDEMPDFYRTGDIFVLPTFYDACSNAVVEALACGSRVVSTRFNGSSVFLPPEKVLDDPADEHELARKALLAFSEPHEAFFWPEDLPCGMEPYLDLVRELLHNKNSNT
ncbi:glycosyltransferase [Salidesulfovibrio brasiliensis]|uniref:glycosyltransferase n=1 Tax=Salidesulfovibrio brasiliensis TaxID=221711 RepID=UPI001FE13873|nr:glycosyltransferase [Salidesulfovibrio brasiliensis]